jgi:hypothetical protein
MSLILSNPNQEREIRELAEARKEPPEKVLSDLVGEALAQESKNGDSPAERESEQQVAWKEFVASMSEWSKNLRPGHRVDDSRESIYAGRGE